MVKQRQTFRQYATEEQKQRALRDECPWCGKPRSEWTRRKDWACCSKECSDAFYSDSNPRTWQQVRMAAFKRDGFKCVKCGYEPKLEMYDYVTGKFVPRPRDNRWWEHNAAAHFVGDHIKPIACGGDEWDLLNIQTLCDKCNKAKTALDAKQIAIERKREKHKILL